MEVERIDQTEPAKYVVSGVESGLMTRTVEHLSAAQRPKWLGAYYTDSQIAEFLVWWAVRNSTDSVIDPSFGGGVFLRSASKRLHDLGAEPQHQVGGVELDAEVHMRISDLLRREFKLHSSRLVRSDFFELSPDQLPPADAVVGNPPFIRYQRFSGETRKRALIRAAEQGLKLSELSSSWLPFLVHSVRFVRPGGRLAMVIPFEIGHASYARPVLAYLSNRFDSITFLTFRQKLFPELNENTLLLLAEGRHEPGGEARFYVRDLEHSGRLRDIQKRDQPHLAGLRRLDTEGLVTGEERIIESFVPLRARDLYRELRGNPATVRLGNLADVGIGYVTGANNFFHLSPPAAKKFRIPEPYLRPCLRRGRFLHGLRLTEREWKSMLATGEAAYLLDLPGEGELPEPVRQYLAQGEREGIPNAYKCRTRKPWYRVPHVYEPDGFLTYMSGDRPRLVANDTNAVAPNTLHIVRVRRGLPITADGIAALWRTSLASLSVEIEGHSLGGGMLKLEPREAQSVLLPFAEQNGDLNALAADLDQVARSKGDEACRNHADEILLRRGLGLSTADVKILRESAASLRDRRNFRSTANE